MDDAQPTGPLPGQQSAPPAEGPVPPGAVPSNAASSSATLAEPFYKRHGLAFAISTFALGAVVVFGLAGAGAFAVGTMIFHNAHAVHENDGRLAGPLLPGWQGNGNGNGNGNGEQIPRVGGVVWATVSSISGDTWKVETLSGETLTVTTTSSTKYGVSGQPTDVSGFAKGDEVIVVGKRSGGVVAATRILKVDLLPQHQSATPRPIEPSR
ncbi:hypothetical protein ATY41_07875 [Leifsonia xyli subsp. xyli]|uniref:DUF5666 domain-containing protein n=2 Tax=Leifsonia xyli subsp. xyli TaxID=59736 RepID=Q6AEL9_LEIXX|nr:DUF5666 domain-containing protein [Leifsonia xyli]AAT89177.1 hypothetical protein Lxx13470 [Leifsonia xyli subsp. xyli str. CTCB07]ODA90835.1 hypothetical protein ATY41_07875 [Leifsonia xyli subsp. xyli]